MQNLTVSNRGLLSLKIIARAWGWFIRIPFVNQVLLVFSDFWKFLMFWSDQTERETQRSVLENCKSLDDYFQLSKNIFGPHQIKHEITSFLEFARGEKPEYLCEIGTADGGTNFLLSQAIPSTHFMVGVDLYVKNRSKLHYFSKPNQQMNYINGSSYGAGTVDKVKHLLGDKKLDLLFIDGDHSYEGVKQDFLKYRHLVRDGGIIVFHDIVPDYLTRYGTQTGRWVGDVPRFWNKIKCLYPHYEFVEDPEQDGLGIGAIRYSAQISLPEEL